MIQQETHMAVADNTGAKEVMCIKVLGGSKRRTAGLGDIIICSVKSVIAGSEIKKKAVVRAVVVRTKSPTRRKDGSYVKFDSWTGISFESTPPCGYFWLRRMCFLARITPSTIALPVARSTLITRLFWPLSLPVITSTVSPVRINIATTPLHSPN